MTRLGIKLAQWRHHALLLVSASYREHDRVISDRDKWRRECATLTNQDAGLRHAITDLENTLANVEDQLRLATARYEHATQQLIAERALRQSADTRADKYHYELIEALKLSANWNSRMVNRRSMYPEVDTPELEHDPPAVAKEPKQPVEFPQKKFAREVVREVSNKTLRDMLDDIRNGKDAMPQVGPESFAG